MRRLLSTALILLVSSPLVWADAVYTLKPGDVVSIGVWGEEGLSRELRVLPDGSISYPFVGRVDVADLGVTALEEKLEAALNDYIPAPDVWVSVSQTTGSRIFVMGAVATPGAFALPTPMSVMQALALAGGLTPFADDGGIRVLRGAGEAQTTLKVDYSDIMKGRSLNTNYTLQSGDTVLVP